MRTCHQTNWRFSLVDYRTLFLVWLLLATCIRLTFAQTDNAVPAGKTGVRAKSTDNSQLHKKQQGNLPPRQLAVDVVTVRGIGRICGFVLEQDKNHVKIVVRREWLQQNQPSFHAVHSKAEKASVAETSKVMAKRIREWKDERSDDIEIQEFISDNAASIESIIHPPNVAALDFTVIEFKRNEIRKVILQKPEHRTLAGIGWTLEMDDVESVSAQQLKQRFDKMKIDVENFAVDLSGKIPPTIESEESWQLRKSLVEFALLDRIEFQGNNGMFFPRGNGGRAGATMRMIMPMMKMTQMSHLDRLGKELGVPEFQKRNRHRFGLPDGTTQPDNLSSDWLKPMIESTESKGRRSFAVYHLKQSDSVTVDAMLFGRGEDGKWKRIQLISVVERLEDQTQEELDAMKKDPQIATVLSLAKQMSMGDEKLAQRAVQNGVATQKALATARSKMNEFIDSFANQIDFPKVPSATQPVP